MKSLRFWGALFACSLLSLVAMVGCAKSDSISEVDKSRIEKIIHDYLLNNPQLLIEVSKKLQEQQQQEMQAMEKKAEQSIPKLAKPLFHSQHSPILGNPEGTITIVEFFDYQCPHCKEMLEVIETITQKNQDVRVVLKEFPIFGTSSMEASRAALAAGNQGKYNVMHEALMNASNPLNEKKIMEAAKQVGINTEQLKRDMESQAVRQELEQNLMLSQKLGLMGTPAFVVGSTQNAGQTDMPVFFVPGAASTEMLQAYVEKVRQSH